MSAQDRVSKVIQTVEEGAKVAVQLSAEELKRLFRALKAKKIEIKPTDASTGRIIANTALGGVLGAGVGMTGGYWVMASMATEALAASEIAGAAVAAAATPLWPIAILGIAGAFIFGGLSYFGTSYSITINEIGRDPQGTPVFMMTMIPD